MIKQNYIIPLTLLPAVLLLLSLARFGQLSGAVDGATIHYVAPGANCNGASPCYATLQAAVDNATAGDEIRLAAGTYSQISLHRPVNSVNLGSQVLYIDKPVTIRGGYTIFDWNNSDPDANPAILDAQGNGRVIYVDGSGTAMLVGLHITGGDSTGQGGNEYGGGIYATQTTLTISDTVVENNMAAGPAGGIFIIGNGSHLLNNEIRDNSGECNSGAFIFGKHVVIRGNTFTDNNSSGGNCYIGGGLGLVGDNGLIENNSFTGNSAYGGGGLSITGNSTISANTFLNNDAVYGGAIYAERKPLIIGNLMANNAASQGGGGAASWLGDPILINNVIVDNEVSYDGGWGDGIFVGGGHPQLIHNTIAGNEDVGIFVRGFSSLGMATVEMVNNMVLAHTVGITVTKGDGATLDGTLWGTGIWANVVDWGGAGSIDTGSVNIWGNPAFVNPAGLNYRLTGASAARDSGIDAGIVRDADGNPRPSECNFDIGAYEFQGGPCFIPTTGGLIQNVGVNLTIPADTFSETVVMTISILSESSIPDPSTGLRTVGNQFDLNATFTNGGPAQPLSGQTYTLTATYREDLAGTFAAQTALYYWGGGNWLLELSGINDVNNHQVTASPDHLSLWALFAPADERRFLPLITK